MIDIHSHIIPEIDDGATSLEEALSMCRMAWEDGTKAIVATPHTLNGIYQPEGTQVADQITALQDQLREEDIGLEIFQGAEVYSCPDLPLILKEEPTLTLNGQGKYFLLEFPHSIIPPQADQLIFQLKIRNFTPIIVHPERNMYVQSNIELLARLVEYGAFSQATAMSFTGGFGSRARECAYELLRRGLVHVIASDAHNASGRPPILSRAYQLILECAGAQKARDLFETFPRKILSGEV